ncbi:MULTISPECIES: ParB/RepB/Spo0J family partition protein [Alistipes]|uniref:ParB/RepB/Spo0J family partition protein n=1 Tax=Alistipes TaxID=239759 RepID=UPI001459A6D2|nr:MULTISPECIES: ParB/RepB/Spo0J family partition protein [Alistipes]MCI7140727.1 ParB/RepB/Spo0J family partition protein [Alistipes sp.]MCI7308701.1 ParB/RepB/Spo0J family partition protein [Alistipes senegalensis]MCI7593875.1 ParB/RepB/Spo0J family partition protein [Alistipes shahii]MDD7038520.1 ParB/RepB/Spo0J family partition protein [Alistipes senegalensis]MDY4090649.1 ParB/RepB/Spo0J family partition protein [Alistipes finegoldii]
MQTMKSDSKSKKSGKGAAAAVIVPVAVTPETQGQTSAETAATQDSGAEVQASVAPTVPVQQEEPLVQLLDLNKIVNSTYNPRKDFREETLLELSESIRQSGVLQPICVRPKDEGFEIVYGERRYWAAAMAGLKYIPALVRELTDAEAEDAAITENLQREDVKPREEAAAYNKAIQSGRHTIESLVGKFGKSEAYIRSRLKLCGLIDALAEQLDKEEISVGVATEIAKYPAEVQQQVFDEHFAEGCYSSWKNARVKEIARRLYERYMTKLESYNFDKTECLSCQHNTANQVLFRDECSGGCAGCQNRECMIRKNEEFLVQKALKLLKDDPRTTLATTGDTPVAVLEALGKEGYHVEELEYHISYYDEAPQMPDTPQAENYVSETDFAEAQERYEARMARFAEQTQQLEFDVSEGRVRKYAVIRSLDIEFRYEELDDEEREVTVDDGQGGHTVHVTVVPPSPLEGLLQQDRRNREICYEHITTDMKRVFLDVKVANKPLQKEEQQMFYYAVMQRVMSDSKLRQCGFRPKESSYLTDSEQFAAAGRITAKQQAALIRAYLVDYFRSAAPEYRCTDETLLTGMMCRFADMNFTEQSQKVQQEYLKVYERRKARLQEQIDALHAKAEAEEMAVSMQEVSDFEPEQQPEEPEVQPDEIQPQLPTVIPADPEIEPDTRMPEEMHMAA